MEEEGKPPSNSPTAAVEVEEEEGESKSIQPRFATRWVTLYSTVLLQREIAYSVDFFQSQVPRTKRYPVYFLTPPTQMQTSYM